jgi:hypothetical protein
MGFSAGTRLGPYNVVAPLGAGGLGEVWKGRDTRLDREITLTILPEKTFEDDERRARLERDIEWGPSSVKRTVPVLKVTGQARLSQSNG